MAMDAKVYAILSEGLKDRKVIVDGKEHDALSVVGGWFDVTEGTEKVRKANEEISGERDDLKKQVKELKKASDEAKKELERYRENALTDDDKKAFDAWKKTGMTSDIEAKINALQSKLDASLAKQAEAEKQAQDEKAATAKALRDKADGDLRSELQTKLAEKKITGKNAKLAIAAMAADGLAKLNEKGERVFTIVKDGKNLAATIDELITDFATQNENLVDASGSRGTGNDHGTSTNRQPGGGGGQPQQTLHQVQQGFQSELAMTK
jgi:DNA repair exonuclease SbcCD ATPase subunit